MDTKDLLLMEGQTKNQETNNNGIWLDLLFENNNNIESIIIIFVFAGISFLFF